MATPIVEPPEGGRTRIAMPRRSTIVLMAIFLATFILYAGIKPEPVAAPTPIYAIIPSTTTTTSTTAPPRPRPTTTTSTTTTTAPPVAITTTTAPTSTTLTSSTTTAKAG